jgi:cation diffusion facilitator family transporter
MTNEIPDAGSTDDHLLRGNIFLGARHDSNARKTRFVLILCATMMVVEIVGGLAFGSMALLADGLHMATHAGAMLVAVFAYAYARRHVADPAFAFGTGKVGDLVAFGSAVFLAATAAFIILESIERLIAPVPIDFSSALPVAVVGLLVNIASVWLLRDDHHHHGHGHGHGQEHDHHHQHDAQHHHHSAHHHDLNLRAAYIHVVTDLAVSVLAIIGLAAGRVWGWTWLDPVMGLIGGYVILRWSVALLRAAARVLLDRVPDGKMEATIRTRLTAGGADITDFRLWQIGPGHHGLVASLATEDPAPAGHYHAALTGIDGLSHVTIEVRRSTGNGAA